MIKIAVCDDEILTANKIANLIDGYLCSKKFEYSIDVFESPASLFKSDKYYDILFLDIEMPKMSGIELAKRAKEIYDKTIIFFITNYENYLDDAFDVSAFRYMRKPIDETRLYRGIDSAINKIQKNNKQIILHALNKIVTLNIGDIIFITIENRKCRIITIHGAKLVDDKLKEIYKLLPENTFVYSHKSYLVNLNYVTHFDCEKVILEYNQNKYNAYMSRRMYSEFKLKFMLFARGVL